MCMKRFLLLFFAMALAISTFAQERIVSGKITSQEDGSALPGVNILVKGTTTGTVTDSEGNYRLSIPSGSVVLVFSFIGLQTQELDLAGRTTLDVQMASDVQQLSEVVVTAVGIQREAKALGYSVAKVSNDKMVQKSEPDVLRSLQGKVPGLVIAGSGGVAGSSTRITIRGVNSFFGANQPLFVVDGIPYDNSLNNTADPRDGGAAGSSRIADLDPNNIESMNVLKGAAAAALYGTRAANGVIVITTKSGSARSSKKGLEVTYATAYSQEKIANLPDYQNSYGAGSQGVYANANGTWGPAYSRRDSIPYWNGYTEAFPNLAGKNVKYQPITDNVEKFFRNGSVFENSISMTGGNEKAAVTAVISDMKQVGFIPNSDFRRTNFSVGGNAQLDNGLIIGGNLAYTKSLQNGPLLGNNATSPFSRLLFMPRDWPLNDLPYINPANGNSVFFFPFASAVDNPYWSVYHNLYKADVDRTVASFNIGKDFTDWLNITYKVGYNTYTDRRKMVNDKGSSAGSQGIGSIVLDNIFFGELESNFLVTFNKDLSPDLNLRTVVGHNINQRVNDQQSVTSLGIIANGIYDIDNTSTVRPNGGTYFKRRLWAVYGDVSLGYKNWAFLNATIRNDNSSTLPANNRSYIYPSVSGSFVFTDAFDIKSDILTSGKLRASWSKVGRDANPYQLFNTYNINFGTSNNAIGDLPDIDAPFNGQSTATVNTVSFNPNLKPEFTTEVELGGEFTLLNGRVGLDVAYYNRLSTNQIANRAVPSASGFDFVVSNFGSIRNKGWEVGLNVVPVQTATGFKWSVYTAFTRNRNVVEELAEGVQELVVRNLFTTIAPVIRPGLPYGVFRGTRAARDSEGNYLINPATGLLIPDTQQGIVGDPNPKFNLGVTNTLSYKNFTLSAVIDYKYGGDLFSQTTAFLLGRGTTTDTEDRDVPKVVPGVLGNPNTLQPLADANGNPIPNNIQVLENNLWFQAQGGGAFAINAPTEFSVFDATVIRLREVVFSYNLPKKLLDRTPFGALSLSLTGRNLWYNAPNFPKGTNFDPEISTLGAGNAQGFDFNAAPSVKRYGASLRVTF